MAVARNRFGKCNLQTQAPTPTPSSPPSQAMQKGRNGRSRAYSHGQSRISTGTSQRVAVGPGKPISKHFLYKNQKWRYSSISRRGRRRVLGGGGARRKGEENALETFCTQPETRVDFFNFFAYNPLKSPDSDE
jgi:hypothetical protein